QAEFFGQDKSLTDPDHRNPENEIVADLRGLAVARAARVNGRLSHGLEDRLAPRKGCVAAADHEGESLRRRAGNAARYRRIEAIDVRLRRSAVNVAGGSDVDG